MHRRGHLKTWTRYTISNPWEEPGGNPSSARRRASYEDSPLLQKHSATLSSSFAQHEIRYGR
jgi:hypothetical protein